MEQSADPLVLGIVQALRLLSNGRRDSELESFGQRVIRARTQAGLSQRQFAQRFRIPLGTLRRWEQEHRKRAPDTASDLLVSLIEVAPELTEKVIDNLASAEPAEGEKKTCVPA